MGEKFAVYPYSDRFVYLEVYLLVPISSRILNSYLLTLYKGFLLACTKHSYTMYSQGWRVERTISSAPAPVPLTGSSLLFTSCFQFFTWVVSVSVVYLKPHSVVSCTICLAHLSFFSLVLIALTGKKSGLPTSNTKRVDLKLDYKISNAWEYNRFCDF